MPGDKKEFINLINKNRNIIHSICNVYCGNHCDREDLTQEIIYQLWKSFSSFKNKSLFSTWMYRVSLNTAISTVRAKKKSPEINNFSENLNEIPDSADSGLDKLSIELNKAIIALRPLDKALIMLWLEKKKYSEISEITGLSEKNVSVRLVRIRADLKEALKHYTIEI